MDPRTRRDFIAGSAAGAAALALGGCGGWRLEGEATLPATAPRRAPSTLSQIKGSGIQGDPGPALVKLLAPHGGIGAFVKHGQTVLLKPNMGFDKPASQRATTSAAVIAAMARLCLEQGAGRVVIADHQVPTVDTADVVKAMGLTRALAGIKAELMTVDDDSPWVERPIPGGKRETAAEFLKIALEADVHIAMPVAKSHGSAGFTGTLKGMMGLIRSRMGFHLGGDLHQSIVDLNRVLRAHLVVMDGLTVMSTGGPSGPGKLIRADTLVAGTDPVAVDAAAVRLAPLYGEEVDPGRIRHLALAEAQGIGRIALPAAKVHQLTL